MNSFSDILREVNGNDTYSLRNTIRFLMFSSSKSATFQYRLSKYFYDKGYTILAQIFKKRLEKKYGLHISLKSEIKYGIKFPHVNGIVIGDGVVMGINCTIYHQVTLGGQRKGDGKKGNYPVVGDNVTIFSGAKILGNVKIGDGSVIGANSVVISDIEPNSVYAGIPAKKIR